MRNLIVLGILAAAGCGAEQGPPSPESGVDSGLDQSSGVDAPIDAIKVRDTSVDAPIDVTPAADAAAEDAATSCGNGIVEPGEQCEGDVCCAACRFAASSGEVAVSPGDDLQAAVSAHAAGTHFCLRAGTYRMQSVAPKDGDAFQGEPGALLTGARVLTGFTAGSGRWSIGGQTQEGQVHGQCDTGKDGCQYPEDVFYDGTPLVHVTALADLAPGKWYFDYAADTIYVADDPAGHAVETSVTRAAFAGAAKNVVVRGLVVEKYAIPAQMGAIGDQYPGPGWIVENDEVRYNHGTGINMGTGGTCRGNRIHHNGQKGLGAGGDDVLIEKNEIDHNLWAGYDWGWEGGGTKFSTTTRLVVRGNHVHDNVGPGLWTDIDNIDTLYEDNLVENNGDAGIFHEISFKCTIRNNVLRGNGTDTTAWLWGAAIQISTSKDCEIYGNTVTVPAPGGNGIALLQQNRGTSTLYGLRETTGNDVHDNDVTYAGTRGQSGAAADYNQTAMFATGNDRFDKNHYHASSLSDRHWGWNGSDRTWAEFQAQGQDIGGTADTNVVVP